MKDPGNAFRRERLEVEKAERKDNTRKGRVETPDGPGVILTMEYRKNTNGGPGTRQYRVKLDDGRVRHYTPTKVTEIK